MSSAAHTSKRQSPIKRVLEPIQGRLAAAFALAVGGAMLTLLPLAGIAHIAKIALANAGPDSLASVQATGDVWRVAFLSVLSALIGMALISAGEMVAHLADNRLTHQLRLAIAKRLGQVPLGWFTSRASGEVKQAMQDDISTLHSLTAHFFTSVGRALGAITISVVYLLALDWRLALLALLPFPGFFLFLQRAMKASGSNMGEFAARMGRINSATTEFISGIPVVKTFGARGQAHSGYREAVDAFAEAFVGFTRPLVKAMAHAHAMIAPVTVLAVVLSCGAWFVGQGWIAPVDLIPFALVAPGICAPVLLLHTLLHDLGSASSAAQRVQALLETPVLDTVAPGQLPLGHEVVFEGVSYGYEAEHQALSNVGFMLKPGTVTAIVGSSGSGKTTLARLLLRFFDPTEGRITFGGVDLRHIEPSVLYQRIGFVLQDVRLIHGTVRENIALGRPSSTQEEVERAARAASIHERILALPRGYESVVGEDALLSGGEQQRVSIARAVLLDPPVLVLDEATSATDIDHETAIQEAISRFAKGRTLLIVSHQLDAIKHADQILVLDGGTLVECGTHDQLMACNGRYAQLRTLAEHSTWGEPAC
nr:ABC transporter ATP-binding protein [Ottowia thiooxydans]